MLIYTFIGYLLMIIMRAYFTMLIFLSSLDQFNKRPRILSLLSVFHLCNLQATQNLKNQAIKTMSNQMVVIDGSVLEGGGQIIRNAISLSALTRTPVKIFNIRAGRGKPGLMEQHLKGLQLVRDISNGELKGAGKGSTTVEFIPDKLTGGNYISEVQTAGSISLVLQISLPCALFADGPIHIQMQGGTNADFAPQIDYMDVIFKANLEKMGASFNLAVKRRGYFPRGGGKVHVSVNPIKELQPVVLEDVGEVGTLEVFSFVTKKEDIIRGVQNVFGEQYRIDFRHEDCNKDTPKGNCGGVMLSAKTSTGCVLGGSGLQNPKKYDPDVGLRAAEKFLGTLREKVCFDEHCQDQMILFMALANGTSRIKVGKEVTLHTKTAIYVAELMTKAKFNVIEVNDHSIIECHGIGLRNQRYANSS